MISYQPMAMKCMSCGKGVMYGHNVSHSKRRTPRVYKPNLHSTRVDTGNGMVRVKLCTKCLRNIKRVQVLAKEAQAAQSSAETPQTQAVVQ